MQEKKHSILIVDDEPNNIALLKDILIDEYTLFMAKDGAKAISLAQKNMPNLILLDIMMPEMDGFEACRQLKANPLTKNIPVIFVTALSDIGDEAQGFKVGAADYITKPVSAAIVKARVQTQISLKQLTYHLTDQVQQAVDNMTVSYDLLFKCLAMRVTIMIRIQVCISGAWRPMPNFWPVLRAGAKKIAP